MDVEQRVAIEGAVDRIQAFAHAITNMIEGTDTGKDKRLEHFAEHRIVSPGDFNAVLTLIDCIQKQGEAVMKAVYGD